MSKSCKRDFSMSEQESAFEMIELSMAGLDVLTRAFEVIERACQETQTQCGPLIENPPKELIN
ncbi:MAG: hypothetical protein K1X79_14365 [Oligoflexia bacterium]|nr:hypothetical protein [Oligoflexia bacterium]